MNQNTDFGFNELNKFKPKDKLDIKSEEEIKAIDNAGKELGFVSRHQIIERRKKKGITKPTDQFNLRAHIEDINRFVDYSEKTNLSYREVFSNLVSNLPD